MQHHLNRQGHTGPAQCGHADEGGNGGTTRIFAVHPLALPVLLLRQTVLKKRRLQIYEIAKFDRNRRNVAGFSADRRQIAAPQNRPQRVACAVMTCNSPVAFAAAMCGACNATSGKYFFVTVSKLSDSAESPQCSARVSAEVADWRELLPGADVDRYGKIYA